MNTDDVWRLVEQARSTLGRDREDDNELLAERVIELAAQRDPADIFALAQPFADLHNNSYRADLWAAAYIINGGCSDDGFDYFRGWLIAQGQAVYEQVLADPDSLAAVPAIQRAHARGDANIECEGMISVAWLAYEEATGEELPGDAYGGELPELDPDWDFDFDDLAELRRRLPRLTTLYYGPPAS
jgi:hypothetical protein